ncbi:MAG: twin-arginine translocase TatA/TatE family subunit [Anaerolineae bacterium]|nr:twin-arginine translocase TatA/TatE family subunit [Anaerolineae bacterium]
MPARIGTPELLIILFIVIMIFGVGKLPEIGSALGRTVREFRKANDEVEGMKSDVNQQVDKVKGKVEKVESQMKQEVERVEKEVNLG